MMPLHDIDVFGIYFTPASFCLLVGVILLFPARRLLDVVHLDRFVWNRALFDLAILIAITSGLVLSLRFGGT